MTKIAQKIIKLLADHPMQEFYGQEIADKIKCSKASASNILGKLAEEKIILKVTKGHMGFYRINYGNIDVKKIRIESALERIKPLLPRLEKVSQKIILFGSASRGEQTVGSDIDLFILSEEKAEAGLVIKKNIGLKIKAVIKTAGEWSELEVREPEFYQEIKNGIVLYSYVPRI